MQALAGGGGLEAEGFFQMLAFFLADSVALAAVRAKPPYQPLANPGPQAVHQQKRLNAGMTQPQNGRYAAVGVDPGQHELSGVGGVDNGFPGFPVRYGVQQYDVGVLFEGGCQAFQYGQP